MAQNRRRIFRIHDLGLALSFRARNRTYPVITLSEKDVKTLDLSAQASLTRTQTGHAPPLISHEQRAFGYPNCLIRVALAHRLPVHGQSAALADYIERTFFKRLPKAGRRPVHLLDGSAAYSHAPYRTHKRPLCAFCASYMTLYARWVPFVTLKHAIYPHPAGDEPKAAILLRALQRVEVHDFDFTPGATVSADMGSVGPGTTMPAGPKGIASLVDSLGVKPNAQRKGWASVNEGRSQFTIQA